MIVPALMMVRGRFFATISVMIILLASQALHAQDAGGEVRGKVTSQETGQPVVRATVKLVDTKLGAISDLNGTYSIRKVPAGRYTVRVSYLGYKTQDIVGVDVSNGLVRVDIVLQTAAISSDSIVVTARGGRGTEAALLNERRKSAVVSDGISAAQIRRLPDATGAEALSRVTGLSIVGSRYVNIRGSNERYNNTQLNGVALVSTDPGKRSFSFDLVPSNLLENTVVAKTFTPDLPGDFSGGLVQMNTTDFPDERVFRFSVAGSYVGGTTFGKMQFGPRGKTDFLGLDDGLRALPAMLPDTPVLNRNYYKPEELVEFAAQIPNNFRLSSITAAPNLNFVASYGDRISIAENDFGIVAALSYRNNYQQTGIYRYDTTTGSIAKFRYNGTQNEFSTLWGGLLNFSYKISDLHTIGIKNTYNHTAEDQMTSVEGLSYYFQSEGQPERRYTYNYLQRSFYSGQLTGEHLFPALNDMRLQWRGFTSLGDRSEPDLRRLAQYRYGDSTAPYTVVMGTFVDLFGSGRVYTDLNEELFGFGGDLTIPAGPVKFKVGSLVENKLRNVSTRSFVYSTSSNSTYTDTAAIDSLFDPNHIRENGIAIFEATATSDKYDAQSNLQAGYIMADLPFVLADQRFRAITGARYENSRVLVHTVDASGEPVTVDYPTADWLPSASLIYEVTPVINVRLAYSRTLARPDFREFARNVFYDFILDALTYGNPDLRRSLISNYDFRFEVFPDPGDLVAVSVFHKRFVDAIEEVAIVNQSTQLERTWQNTNGTNTGVELEVRKSFGFLSESFAPFSFTVNYTWLDSKLDLQNVDSGRAQRKLQGQSPYIINAGLYYDNADIGTSISLSFNRFGERISTVSNIYVPDLVEQPRNRFDLTISQDFLENYQAKLTVRDLFPDDIVFTRAGQASRIDDVATSVSLGITSRF